MTKPMSGVVSRGITAALAVAWLGALSTSAQDARGEQNGPPTGSSEQEMNQRNTLPRDVVTEIIAADDEGRERAQRIIEPTNCVMVVGD
ncbi:MAG: hypothetical protein AAGI30_11155 [Planctomycetota bacterium]